MLKKYKTLTGQWFFPKMDTSPKLKIRHAHHDMLRRCRCERMERNYLRFKKKEVSEV